MQNSPIKLGVSAMLLATFLSACATPEVVQTRQVGDRQLSCAELRDALLDAEEFGRRARAEKGVTGTNVAAAAFFWPALIATYANAEEAESAARERQDNLIRLADAKGCPAF